MRIRNTSPMKRRYYLAIVTEARDRLAGNNQYDGVFEKWFTSLGFKKANVYRLIDRFLLVQKLDNIDDKERIEELPATLSYEIAKPNAEDTAEKSQAKTEVLAGDIATLKEYRERIKELERKAEQAEKQTEAERKERERLELENARDDLKRGQKAAIVIRLFYEEERQKASERQATSTGGRKPQLIPKLDEADNKTTNEILAKKAGIGKSSIAYLLAVYRNRPDLFELVFDGTYTINKAYTQMKADEAP